MTEHQWYGAKEGGHRRHQNRAKAQQAGLSDGLFAAQMFVALCSDCKVHDQNPVLLNKSNQKNDSNGRNDGQVEVETVLPRCQLGNTLALQALDIVDRIGRCARKTASAFQLFLFALERSWT